VGPSRQTPHVGHIEGHLRGESGPVHPGTVHPGTLVSPVLPLPLSSHDRCDPLTLRPAPSPHGSTAVQVRTPPAQRHRASELIRPARQITYDRARTAGVQVHREWARAGVSVSERCGRVSAAPTTVRSKSQSSKPGGERRCDLATRRVDLHPVV
jgi:hypothetical protein